MEWKEIAKKAIQKYVSRVEGSTMEIKSSGVVWKY